MSALSLMAASEFAHVHASHEHDPIKFGHDVALAYLACFETWAKQGDKEATAAALASLSVPSEVWKLLAQLSEHFPRSTTVRACPLPTGGTE